jgi:hypothetical protein
MFVFIGPHRAVLINYPNKNELTKYLPWDEGADNVPR